MNVFNPDDVMRVLAGTLHHETSTRTQAEQDLSQLETRPGFAALLLQITVDQAVHQSIKQSAILRLKHNILNYWDITSLKQREESQIQVTARSGRPSSTHPNPLTEDDRAFIRENLFKAIVLSVPIIRVQLLECVRAIAKVDLPFNWPSINRSIMQSIDQPVEHVNVHLMHCGLLTLLTIVARWEFVEAERRAEPINQITSTMFPSLLSVLQFVNSKNTHDAYQITHIVCKIVYKAIHLSIPTSLRTAEQFMPWFNALLTTLHRPVPVDQSVSQSNEQAKHPLWKAKKWVAHLMLGIFSRFGFEKDVKQATNKVIAKMWRKQCVKPALTVFFQLISQSNQSFVSSIVKYYAYEFFRLALKMLELRKMIQSELNQLINQSILNQLSLSHSEIQLFINDPQEFIRLTTDILEDFKDPRRPAAYLLIDLCQLDAARRNNEALKIAIQTINQAMVEYQSNPNDERLILRKEGAMRMMVSMRAMVCKEGKEELKTIFIGLIENHVVPELKSPHGFMKVRALDVIGGFYSLEWSNPILHAAAVSSVCNCLLPNQSLPVRLAAIGTVSRLISDSEMLDMLAPAVTALMDACFTLVDEVGNGEVIEIMTVLFEKLGERLIPFVSALVQKFCAMILTLCEAEDSDDESALTCVSAIQMVGTVVTSLADREREEEDEEGNMSAPVPVLSDEARMAMLQSIEPHILPVIARILGSDNLFEFYDDCVDLVNAILYTAKSVPANFWPVLPRLIAIFIAEGSESLQTLTSAVDCFCAFGGPAFVENSIIVDKLSLSMTPVSPLDHVVLLVTRMFGAEEKTNDERINKRYACKMIQSIFANHRGRVNHVVDIVVPQLAAMLLTHGSVSTKTDDDRTSLNLSIMDTFASLMIYDATLCLQALSKHPLNDTVSNNVFNVWMGYMRNGKMDESEYHSRMSVLGLAALCSLSVLSLPVMLQSQYPTLLALQIEQLAKLKVLYDAMEEEDGQYDDEDYGWEEGDYGGREEDWDEDDEEDDELIGQSMSHAGDEKSQMLEQMAANDADEEINPATQAEWLKMAQSFDEEGVEDAHYDSPVDDLDPFITFMELMQTLQSREPIVFQQLKQTYSTALATIEEMAKKQKEREDEQ